MKAAFFMQHGGPEVLSLRDHDPGAPAPGQVRIAVHAAGVNFIDTYQRSGLYPRTPPFVLGMEGAGEVQTPLRVGPKSKLRLGDPVFFRHAKAGELAEHFAEYLLVRGDNDSTLVIGADPGATMPQPAIDHLTRTPTIVLDPKVTHTSRLARVHITTAATGISAPGTVYRMDEIPLPLRPLLKSPYPTDEEVVRRITAAVRKKAPWLPTMTTELPVS